MPLIITLHIGYVPLLDRLHSALVLNFARLTGVPRVLLRLEPYREENLAPTLYHVS